MAAECSQQAVLDFLRENGGRVKHADLVERFKAVFPEEPEERAAVRETFKSFVDNIAFVKTESGVKYVCLKKKFRASGSNGAHTEPALTAGNVIDRDPAGPRRAGGSDAAEVPARPRAAGGGARQPPLPGSGCGNGRQVSAPAAILPVQSTCREGEELASSSGGMGNRGSFQRHRRESKKELAGKVADIPDVAVTEASPLPAAGSVFTLPGPGQTGTTGPVETGSLSAGGLKEAEQAHVVQAAQGEDGGRLDTRSLSGSEGNSTHKRFIRVNSSPQVRRSRVWRSSAFLSSRSDSDCASLASSSLDDDRTSVALDPLEHEWMMCASDGEWGSLYSLLVTEPSLVLRKDFVTGFTCLHWAAKHGKPELIALIVNFAKQHNIAVGVDVRSSSGYTPLHVAAMHNHMEVVKLLVGAYDADVEIRDYSGRKACQYLTDHVSVDLRDIIGAYERSESENADSGDGGRWRFSRVLQSNLKPLRLLSANDSVAREARPGEKPLRRKSSLSRMKPTLQMLRLRTSQIVRSSSFRETEELEGSVKGSFKARPKTHFLG